jgi:hypothetical protein
LNYGGIAQQGWYPDPTGVPNNQPEAEPDIEAAIASLRVDE